jgi:hypothetical protein
MNFIKKATLISVLSILFSSCFEVVEEMDYYTDGTGHFSFSINMSQSKDKLATIMLLDSAGGLNVPTKQKIEDKINMGANLLADVAGVSNVTSTKNYDNFIFTIALDFASLADLNKAARILHENMSPFGEEYRYVYQLTKGKFTRQPDVHTTRFLSYINKKNSALLKSAEYTLICRFEQPIVKADDRARVSKSKKAVMYKYNLENIAELKDEMNCTIIVPE